MTPEQLAASLPAYVTRDVAWLWGHYYSHVPEIPDARCSGQGVTVRVYKWHYFDERRIWLLACVYIDDKPVMIVRNAGREGDDHADRYVFDLYHYAELLDRLGRRPSDRRDGPKTKLGWQWSDAYNRSELSGPAAPLDCVRADGFFDRHLDSPAKDWEPY